MICTGKKRDTLCYQSYRYMTLFLIVRCRSCTSTVVFPISERFRSSDFGHKLGHSQTIGFRILGRVQSFGFRDFRPDKNHRNALLSHTQNGLFGADFSELTHRNVRGKDLWICGKFLFRLVLSSGPQMIWMIEFSIGTRTIIRICCFGARTIIRICGFGARTIIRICGLGACSSLGYILKYGKPR